MMRLLKCIVLWLIGGFVYLFVEILWRGYSHWSMMILGGMCFVLIGTLNEEYTWGMSLISQMFLSSIAITVLELISGIILNIWFSFGIWDYSQMPYNFLGQICLIYFNLWFLLSLPAILVDDYIRYWIFKEEKPHYKIL
jgi:hypothetical protein